MCRTARRETAVPCICIPVRVRCTVGKTKRFDNRMPVPPESVRSCEQKMKRFFTLAVLAMCVAALIGCDRGKSDSQGQPPGGEKSRGADSRPTRLKMPAFSLKSVMDGSPVTSDAFAGKVLLVTFFATWCPPCIQEMPTLVKLQDELGPLGFSVIGFSVDEGDSAAEIVADLAARMEINYPVVLADEGLTSGFGGVFGIPATFLVDRQGDLVKRYIGYTDHDVFTKDIREQLAIQ